jgi:hypothetical protein
MGRGTRPGWDPAVTGVTYGTGAVTLTRTDLSSVGFGTPWGLDWSWTGAPGYSDGFSGSGSTVGQNAYLVQLNGNTSIALVSGAGAAHFFDLIGGTYVARYGDPSTLVYNTTADEFVATDGTGQTFTFYDFSTSTPTGPSSCSAPLTHGT